MLFIEVMAEDDIFDDEASEASAGVEIDHSLQKLSDREISNELSLPDVLNSLTRHEKLELLVFKRSHNEIDWEEELLQRQEHIAREIDRERLKRMTASDKVAKSRSKKSKMTIEDSDDDLSDFGGIADAMDGSDSDLFDSDEEREILAKKAEKVSASSEKSKSKAATEKKSAREDSDDDLYDEIGDDVDAMEVEGGMKANQEDISEPADLSDYLTIQTRRDMIEKWLKEPYFRAVVEGTYVRLMVGALDDPVTGKKVPVYRMCQVVEITENASRIPFMPGSKSYTTMRLTVAVGSKQKTRVKFHDVSNSRIKQTEFDQYLEEIENDATEARRLSKNEVKFIKNERVTVAKEHKYSKEEVNAMIQKRSGLSKAAHTTHKGALENLEYEIEKAKEEGRLDDLDKISRERDILLEKRNDLESKMTRRNEANMKINRKNYESRFAKDMNASKKNRIKSQSSVTDDPFIRRQTHPENLWSVSTRLSARNSKKEDIGSATFEATMSSQPKHPWRGGSATTATVLDNVDITTSAIRSRVKKRLGEDPVELAKADSAERYLKKVCLSYPPKGTEERENLRSGVSLAEYQAAQ